ncbi:unnamed protein product, partial [Onchocerca flexuosa]|uniref:Smg4_UPF3 domain-containing protein n=1 Tax=Onchocerca flexuosa TaxID=387005 RepID=A0A183I784_9BILA
LRTFEEKKKQHANDARNLFKVYEDEWKRIEHLTMSRRQQASNQSREGDQPRDDNKPRESDQPRDAKKLREIDQPRDDNKPRESDQPRGDKKPPEIDQPPDDNKPRETDQPLDVSSKRLDPSKASSSIPKISGKKKGSGSKLS